MYKSLSSKSLRSVLFLGVAVSAGSLHASPWGKTSCDAVILPSRTEPLGIIEQGELPRQFSTFPAPFQTGNNDSVSTPGTPGSVLSGNSTPTQFSGNTPSTTSGSGGIGDLNLFSGSSGGDSFAANAPGTYIDNAVISNMFRFRVDTAYNNSLPDRAEFFYGQCGCFGGNARGPGSPAVIGNPGTPGIANSNVDYQEFVPYFERAFSKRFSMFAETPFRLINPDMTQNTGGLSDMNFGFKSSIVSSNHQYLTAQFRVYVPTGDARSGLGNGHTSLEPGLLYLSRRNDRLIIQSEFRVWIPLSDAQAQGRNFAGTILRYGIGGGYDLLNLDTCGQRRRLTGTFETVGWTITSGQGFDATSNTLFNASGDTIVNVKSGLRYTFGRRSLAGSYGKPVTGDRWYSDMFRVEYRYAF